MQSNTTVDGPGPQDRVLAPTPGLPPPGTESLAHSERVVDAIRDAITAAGGWISFREFMRIALYAPGLGYYAAGARKIGLSGADSDFVTAPEMTPLFGYALANQFAEVLLSVGGDVLELGAGSGNLAADLLVRLASSGVDCGYSILEPSPDLRERQRATIAARAPQLSGKVRWLDSLPEAWTGVIFGNEVLDALPVEWLVRKDGHRSSRGVIVDGDGWLVLSDRSLDAAVVSSDGNGATSNRDADERDLIAAIDDLFPGGDYASEINPEAEALSATLASILHAGMLMWIDYGFPSHEYYHPQRAAGTLMCHYRHRAHDDPLLWPGLQDITAHVDFSAIARVTCDAGAELAGYATQASFLLDCGIADLMMQESGAPGSAGFLRASNAVQRLLSPAEMGELFKVIAFTRDFGHPLRGFATSDRSGRL